MNQRYTHRDRAPKPTVSVRPYRNEAGTYSVELFIHGLQTDKQAEKMADMLTEFVCGEEIKTT